MFVKHAVQTYKDLVNNPTKKALRVAVELGRTHAVKTLKANGAWDTGGLALSLEPDYSKIGELEARLFSTHPAAPVIEYGAGPWGEKPTPGWWAPVEPLMRWCMRKLGKSEKEARGMAYAIRHNIHKHGFRPRPYMRPAADLIEREFPAILKEELKVGFASGLKKTFE